MTSANAHDLRDSRAAWTRLTIAVLIGTIGSIGMWSFVVALPAVQAGFGVTRAEASLPYTLTMVGFAFGGVLMGRLADRFGVVVPLLIGAASLGAGYLDGRGRPARSPCMRWRRLSWASARRRASPRSWPISPTGS